jgi:hypothetical protein
MRFYRSDPLPHWFELEENVMERLTEDWLLDNGFEWDGEEYTKEYNTSACIVCYRSAEDPRRFIVVISDDDGENRVGLVSTQHTDYIIKLADLLTVED